MYTEYDVVTRLIELFTPLKHNAIALLPDDKKNTSLTKGERCDLSYLQGYRDAMITVLVKLEHEQKEYEDNLPKPEDFEDSIRIMIDNNKGE